MPIMRVWDELYIEQAQQRKSIDKNRICNFGIKALDDCLIGILKNDLVVIGADSGVGKSDICLNMALHNARQGKTVALFFIEGGAEEAIARIKWKAIKDIYYSSGKNSIDLDYRKWRMGMLESDEMDVLENEAFMSLMKDIGGRLHIYEFEDSFTVDCLIKSIGYFSSKKVNSSYLIEENFYDVDLIIIDHLQYFTLANPKNELTEMTQILMKVKDITNFHKIPVVLVSHLRKKDKDRGLPGQEDFYGTGNIAKISSLAFTISSCPGGDDYANQIYPTFFRIVKSRTGIRSSFGILNYYDLKRGKYIDKYELYNLAGDKPCSTPIENSKLPKWAQKNIVEKGKKEWIAGN